MSKFNKEELEKVFDAENYTLTFQGKLGLPELVELVEFVKWKKQCDVVPKFKVGDRVQREGYSYEYGEVLEVDVYINDDGKPLITYTVENVGECWESGLEPFNEKISHEYPW